jgi:hypothetical protein
MTVESILKRVTLHLARSKDFPEGSRRHGYEFIAPLDQAAHLDAEAWKNARHMCTVRRFWADEEEEHGLLVHRPGGKGGATWTFDYDPGADADDEPGFRLETHAFREGEYVSVRDDEGDMHTFVVAAVKPALRK